MKNSLITDALLEAKKNKGLKYEDIANELGRDEDAVIGLFYRRLNCSRHEAGRLEEILGLVPAVVDSLLKDIHEEDKQDPDSLPGRIKLMVLDKLVLGLILAAIAFGFQLSAHKYMVVMEERKAIYNIRTEILSEVLKGFKDENAKMFRLLAEKIINHCNVENEKRTFPQRKEIMELKDLINTINQKTDQLRAIYSELSSEAKSYQTQLKEFKASINQTVDRKTYNEEREKLLVKYGTLIARAEEAALVNIKNRY